MPATAEDLRNERTGATTAAPAGRPVLRGWFHVVALVVFAVAAPLLASHGPTAWTTAALAVYAASLVALFAVSAAFHRLNWTPPARRRMRRADHTTIFVAIAGTYTAVAGLALGGWAQVLVLVLVWSGAAAGIAMRQIWMDAPKWAIAAPYVVVGWCALAVLPQLLDGLGVGGFTLLAAGGALYSVGALVYMLRRPDPFPGVFGYHEVFHLCTVAGAALQFACISVYALGRS
jgi:hemolysin III